MGTVALAIEHVEDSSPSEFLVRRVDGKPAPAVAVPSPYSFPVEGRPNSNLMRELRWYLEHFLDYPFHPDTLHAEHVLDALRSWGTQAFNALFNRRDASEWLNRAEMLQIRSDDPEILSWPWEALLDPQSTSHFATERRIERCLNQIQDPKPAPTLPTDRINILLVVARPFAADVGYRSIARPLVELVHSRNLPAQVDVLRPPTFDQLRDHLRSKPGYYHVLHFDGHGSYTNAEPAADNFSPHQLKGSRGQLYFETADGKPDPKSARDLSALLKEFLVPAVVLNACQSGALDETAEDAFASVATALLANGTRSVVAMAYSLYVSGAQVFLPAFYGGIFRHGTVTDAILEGRKQMLAHKGRVCARGRYDLEDWLLPVLYQQDPFDFSFAATASIPQRESPTRAHFSPALAVVPCR